MVVGSASENLNTTTAAFASKTTFQSGLVLEAGHSGLHSLLQVGSGWSAFKLEQVKFFCLSFGERERERETGRDTTLGCSISDPRVISNYSFFVVTCFNTF